MHKKLFFIVINLLIPNILSMNLDLSVFKGVTSKEVDMPTNIKRLFEVKKSLYLESDEEHEIMLHKMGTELGKLYSSSHLGKAFVTYCDEEEVIQVLLYAGADINATLNNGWTPLIFVAHQTYLPGLELLLKYKADVNKISKDGDNALMKAIGRSGHTLKDYTNAKNEEGFSRFWIGNEEIEFYKQEELKRKKIVQILIESKIDVNYKFPRTGQTALDYATRECYDDIVKILRTCGAKTGEELKAMGK